MPSFRDTVSSQLISKIPAPCAVKYIHDTVDTENLTQLYFPGEMWFPKLMPYDLGRGIKIVFIVIWVLFLKFLHHPVLDEFSGFSLSGVSVSLLFLVT